MNVEIPSEVRNSAAEFGAGVPYALKVLLGQLADDPDMGRPSGLPGVLTVTIDGEMFEDCPALAIGYIREPDRVEVRYVNLLSSSPPFVEDSEDELREEHRPAAAAGVVREVADALHRIMCWLQLHAPASYAALRPGASPATLAALEEGLGVRIPVDLKALWLLTAGDDGGDGWGSLPANRALMNLDAVAATYRLKMEDQTNQDVLNAQRSADESVTVWKATWIPVVALGPADSTGGLYLDVATGRMGQWSRYNDAPGEEPDTLSTYLEEAADMLENPALATRDKPGLIGGALVWLSSVDPAREDRWRPWTG
ncbi:SMI1/KNR4 family protein [Streptomyces sp. CS7]|uniref:SMI1/KNR4 family protein n=1 Tax=Streptomyces sp. CS-7 TaxID=2906769 RepID=UPI0021B21398|nr:SMI1/KNR4 family protein [Streptomyces sp. CS-7]MCT6781917.1 SMI1/KNR4 family protein [Streptomyces sp. CS-7]